MAHFPPKLVAAASFSFPSRPATKNILDNLRTQ